MNQLKKACNNNDLEKVKETLRLDSCIGYRRVALKMLMDVTDKRKALEREQLKKEIIDELEILDGDNYVQWAVNTGDDRIIELLTKMQKISIKDLDDKGIIRLSEGTYNEKMTNMLRAYKDLMLQLEKNIEKDGRKPDLPVKLK